MNGFEAHNIETLSPSKIMLFASSPALFVLENVLKRRQPVGTVAHRGASVECGVNHALENMGADIEECIGLAEAEFRKRAALSSDPRKEKHGKSIRPITINAVNELRPYGQPTTRQKRVTVQLDDVLVPIRGDFDFAWDHHGILSDLKTSDTIPSKIKTSHAWQVSLYLRGYSDNFEGRITYAGPAGDKSATTTPRAVTYTLENPREHLESMRRVALTIQRFLAVSTDPQELIGITAPDMDQYFFADKATRQAAFETWGY